MRGLIAIFLATCSGPCLALDGTWLRTDAFDDFGSVWANGIIRLNGGISYQTERKQNKQRLDLKFEPGSKTNTYVSDTDPSEVILKISNDQLDYQLNGKTVSTYYRVIPIDEGMAESYLSGHWTLGKHNGPCGIDFSYFDFSSRTILDKFTEDGVTQETLYRFEYDGDIIRETDATGTYPARNYFIPALGGHMRIPLIITNDEVQEDLGPAGWYSRCAPGGTNS